MKHGQSFYEKWRDMGLKWCSGCNQPLHIESFGPNRASKDGKQSTCYECRRIARNIKYRALNHKPL